MSSKAPEVTGSSEYVEEEKEGLGHIREGQGIGHEDLWREIEEEKPGKSPRKSPRRRKLGGSLG